MSRTQLRYSCLVKDPTMTLKEDKHMFGTYNVKILVGDCIRDISTSVELGKVWKENNI